MKHAHRLFSRIAVAVAALSAVAAVPAHAADSIVTFNMQVTAQYLDARVNALFLVCSINDASNQPVNNFAANMFTYTPVAGSFNGQLSTKVVVPEAKLKDAKKWECQAARRGPNNDTYNGAQDWGKLNGGDSGAYALGTF